MIHKFTHYFFNPLVNPSVLCIRLGIKYRKSNYRSESKKLVIGIQKKNTKYGLLNILLSLNIYLHISNFNMVLSNTVSNWSLIYQLLNYRSDVYKYGMWYLRSNTNYRITEFELWKYRIEYRTPTPTCAYIYMDLNRYGYSTISS